MRVKALLALLGLGLALIFTAGCNDNESNTGTVTGTVTDSVTGLAVPDATVTLFQNGVQVGQPVVTGVNGTYTFGDIPTGNNYTVRVSSATNAFPTVTSNTFTVTEGTVTMNVSVTPTAATGTVQGTITNASTGLAVADATVTLFQNSAQVATTTTGADGTYSFSNVAVGDNYTITVSSATNAFTTVTTSAFSVTTGVNTEDITVGTGITGSTISGTVGTVDVNATFTVAAIQNGNVVAQTTTGATVPPAIGPTFTLTGVPTGTPTLLRVTSTDLPNDVTYYGPVTVTDTGLNNVIVYTKTAEQLDTDTDGGLGLVPPDNGTATAVAYIPNGGTITVGAQTSGSGNPAYLTGLTAPQTANVTVTPAGGTPINFGNITFAPNTVYVFRLVPAT